MSKIRFKELREEQGLSQKDIAKEIGVTPSAWSAYEKGKQKPSVDVLYKIAERFKISLDWFLGLTDMKNTDLSDSGNLIEFLYNLENLSFDNSEEKNLHNSFQIIEYEYETEPWSTPESPNLILHKAKFLGINCHEQTFQKFLKDWKKMKDLHDEKVIDDDIYESWKKSQIEIWKMLY